MTPEAKVSSKWSSRNVDVCRGDLTSPKLKRANWIKRLVLANAGSYGIYAEMNRQEADDKVDVTCNGIDAEAFTCRVVHPDVPGEYCFPPLASLISIPSVLTETLSPDRALRIRSGTMA